MRLPSGALAALAALLLVACGSAGVAASLDGGSISMADYQARLHLLSYLRERQLSGLATAASPSPTKLSPADERRLEDEAVTSLVDEALIRQEADRRRIGVSEDEVHAQVDATRRLFSDAAAFQAQLNAYGYTEAQLREQLRARLTEVKLVQVLAADRVTRAVAAIKAGTSWPQLVKSFSDLPDSPPDGRLDLNLDGPDRMDPAIRPGIDALAPGQTSAPLLGTSGWFIVHLVDRAPSDLKLDVIRVFTPDAVHYRTQDRPHWLLDHLAGLERAAHVHYHVGSRAS